MNYCQNKIFKLFDEAVKQNEHAELVNQLNELYYLKNIARKKQYNKLWNELESRIKRLEIKIMLLEDK